MKQETAVDWLVSQLNKQGFSQVVTDEEIKQAKEIERQQKIAYKISTTLGHVDHLIDSYGVDFAIEEYEVKVLNNKDSFWEECLAIAKFYKQFNNK
jgi:hypothetical protein